MRPSRTVITTLLGSLLVGGCASVVPSRSPESAPTATPGLAASTAVSSGVALEPCRSSQVVVTPGYSGAATGTAYLRVFVELGQNPACTLPRGPMITVTTDGETEVARATETDPTPVVLDYITGYEIAWNAPCGPTPTGALVAHITFSPTLVVEMPVGRFRPSCVDGSTGYLSMTADDQAQRASPGM